MPCTDQQVLTAWAIPGAVWADSKGLNPSSFRILETPHRQTGHGMDIQDGQVQKFRFD